MGYKNATEEEEASLALLENEIDKYIPKNDDSKVSEEITYTENGETKTLTKGTPAGTKIGTTANIDGQTLDWYLFDVSDDGKTAYLVSTPTPWAPDTTKEVSGAWVPKLVSSDYNFFKSAAMRQAIPKKMPTWDEPQECGYASNSVTYTPSANTLSYYKSVNSQWSANRGNVDFKSLNENEQAACYLADADIFAGIKDQVNNADGNLKGKIQTLVGGASAEQWCKAYNKQTAAKDHQITCEYTTTDVPGYTYKATGEIVGSDIYGAAFTNGNTTNNPFCDQWWLASPSSYHSAYVCFVNGNRSFLNYIYSHYYGSRFSLFASVAL